MIYGAFGIHTGCKPIGINVELLAGPFFCIVFHRCMVHMIVPLHTTTTACEDGRDFVRLGETNTAAMLSTNCADA